MTYHSDIIQIVAIRKFTSIIQIWSRINYSTFKVGTEEATIVQQHASIMGYLELRPQEKYQ